MTHRALLVCLAGLLPLLGTSDAAALSRAARRGRKVMKQAQCTRCHGVTDLTGRRRGIKAAARDFHCVDCHGWILGSRFDEERAARQRKRFPDWDRYTQSIVHFTALPDLGTLTRRVDPSFVRRYLDSPFDLRPHLEESMIPLSLEDRDKDNVVAYLTELNRGKVARLDPADRVAPPADRIAAGKRAFSDTGCISCHTFGNVRFSEDVNEAFYAAMREKAGPAPNLRFVRERIPRKVLVQWILDPSNVMPTALMPKHRDVTPETAELIADFLLHGDFEPIREPAVASVPEFPLLERRVGFAEVNGRVFSRVCVHCHMDANQNVDGGPGNTGGLGFAAIGLDFGSYQAIRRGMKREGKRVSVLEPAPDGGAPVLFEALLRRYAEAERDVRGPFDDNVNLGPDPVGRPGMPMALPPLSREEMSLIKTWLAQGAPGPDSALSVFVP